MDLPAQLSAKRRSAISSSGPQLNHSISFSISIFHSQNQLSLSLMAALARISRQALSSVSPSTQASFLHRALATEAAKAISPSSDRVKWDYRGQRKIIPLGQWLPKIAVDAFVAPNVVLAGQVRVYDGASVWPGSVLRGDLNKITVGFCSNVQERCVLHAAWSSPTGSAIS